MSTQLNTSRCRVTFGEFEFDCASRALMKDGRVLRLEPQPAKVLAFLINHSGRIVTRQEIKHEVWGTDTFVDFDQGLNYAIRRIRAALEDDADAPRFLETIPKAGYRFIATIGPSDLGRTTEPDDALLPAASSHRSRPFAIPATFLLLGLLLSGSIAGWIYRNHIRSAQAIGKPGSIAVLPLRNLSADPEQEYFSEGMTDELITDLARSEKLRVTSHTSVQRYKGTTLPLAEIARQLGVDAIVEGTVMRTPEKVRITVQLIDARTDQHLWADSYERDLRDVLRLQDEVARSIATEIGTRIDSQARGSSAQVSEIANANGRNEFDSPVKPDAHEAYLRGRYWWHRRGADAEAKGLAYFEQAVELDPTYAVAWAGIADSYAVMAHHGGMPANEAMPKAKAAALKAIQLNDSVAEAHTSLALISFSYDWNYPTAEHEFRRAIELDPNYATAHHWYAHYLVVSGRFDEALKEIEVAHQLDPYSVAINTWRGLIYYYKHQYELSAAQLRSIIELDKGFAPFVWDDLAQVYEEQGNFASALKERQSAFTAAGKPQDGVSLARVYASGGSEAYWRQRLLLLQRGADGGAGSALSQAIVTSHLKNREQTLQLLRKAYDAHSPWINFMSREPAFDWLRQDQQFKSLEAKMGLSAFAQ